MKDVHQKFQAMSPTTIDASMPSVRLLQGCVTSQNVSFGSRSFGKNHSLASISLALSLGATGLFASEAHSVQAAEAATLPTSQANRLFSQGETLMIPAPVTLATPPEVQPNVESSQLVAAVSSNSVSRVEPELPAIKHIVAESDTLWSIAQRYNVPVEAIAKLNDLTPDSSLTVGQALKIPPQFNNQPVAAVPQQFAKTKASVEVATLQPTTKANVDQEPTLKLQEDEALSTLRAKQENLAESIKQLRSQSKEVVVFDAEANTPKPKTLISSAALSQGEPVEAPAGSVIIPVPQPREMTEAVVKPVAKVEKNQNVRTLIANNALSSANKLPEPPAFRVPTPELVLPKKEEEMEVSKSVTLTVPSAATVASPGVSRSDIASRSDTESASSNVFVASSVVSKTHVVSPGETLYEIARRYGVSGRELISMNRLDNPNVINVDQTLLIPSHQKAQANNSYVALLPQTEVSQPVNRDSETLASAATLSQTEEKPNEAVVTFDMSAESAVNKLKTDIARMRQEYQQQQVAIAPKTPAVEFQLNVSKANNTPAPVDSEWQAKQAEPVVAVAERVQELPKTPQEIATANDDVVNYNSLLRLSTGDVVSPELPALSTPDQYLPGSQVFTGYIWPAKGTLTSGFGKRWGKMHKGIDIAAPVGTPVFAAAPGEVISAGWNSGGYGNLVEIKHPDGSVTRYAHNSRILVRKGQDVAQGQQISAMGSTGFSTGPHLHFEVRPNGQAASNPIAFLPKK